MYVVVLLGAPGSGKGTQAKRLSGSGNFTHLSTGDMLRVAIQERTEVGIRAKTFVDRGELVPDNVMIEVIEATLSRVNPSSQILLDGFPRTLVQAEVLDAKPLTTVRSAIFFQIPEVVLVQRLTGRRVCKNCGESYHTRTLPPKEPGKCDRCGGELIQRSDDTEDVVRRRLEVFAHQNEPLIGYYRKRACLKIVDANRSVDAIQRELLQMLS